MTRPDDIPADVAQAVEAIMAAVDAGVDWSTEQCIARAIMFERERCAKVAERTYAKDAFHFELGTAIASAIRGGTT